MDLLPSIIVEFNIAGKSFKKLSLAEFNVNLDDKNIIYWIHINLTDIEFMQPVLEKIALAEEVRDLLYHPDSLPKLIDLDEALTIQIEGLCSTELGKNDETSFASLIIHLTSKFCLTAAIEPIQALNEFYKTFQKAVRYAKTPCFILFLILDSVVNDYSHNLYNFELLAEALEKNVHLTHENIYNHVMDVKQEVMKVKRYTISVREILLRISGRKIAVISEQCRQSLNNLSNHTHMVVHEADSIRELLNGLLDQIDNALMQKMNETMRVLTAFASIFLPLSLITGIYGMNFNWIPELSWRYGYFWALGLILGCALLLLYLFKKKKWF